MFRFVLIASAILACALADNPNDFDAYIVKSNAEVRPDGGYEYFSETSIGIAAQESEVDSRWYAPAAVTKVDSTADENGFMLPTPPPIPEEILKSLEYIRTQPTYKEQKPQLPLTKFKNFSG